MTAQSIAKGLAWLKLESCVEMWSTAGHQISLSEALQFCSQGKLKVSCQLFNKLARPVYSYSPLLGDGYYQLVAKVMLAKDNKIPQEDGITFSSIVDAKPQSPSPDINSKEFAGHLLKQREEYDLRLDDKAKEIFSRWKDKGMSHVSFEYGSNRMLDGRYQLVVDKELADCLTRIALDYDISTLDSLYVTNDDGEQLQLINEQNKPVELRLKLGDLIIQRSHRIEFENEFFKNDAIAALTNDNLPTWRDLFINNKNSSSFRYYSERVDAFIRVC